MGNVRPLAVPPQPPRLVPAASVWLLAALAAGLVSWLALFGSMSTTTEAPALPSDPEAVAVTEIVADFAAALSAGQADAVLDLLAERWTILELPGLPLGFVNPRKTRTDVRAALEFYGGVMDLAVGPCRVEPPRLQTDRRRAVCNEAAVAGSWAEAVRAADLPTTMIFSVVDGRIVSVLRAPVGVPAVFGLCSWAEQVHPVVAKAAFDNRCWPVPGPGAVEVHGRLAEEYLRLGRPQPDPSYETVRWNGAVVDRFVELHNLGERTPRYFAPGQIFALPGIVGIGPGSSLDQADVLAWSAAAYRIELGDCSVDGIADAAGVRVSCPEARWAGPLVDALGLGPVPQPVSFVVVSGSITAVEGGTALRLRSALAEVCRSMELVAPVPPVFDADCTPIYGATEARNLIWLLSGGRT